MNEIVVTPNVLAEMPLPGLEGETDKDARGRVLIVAGGRENPGAVVLAGMAAYRAGAGKLQVAAGEAIATPLAFALLEARVITVAAGDDGQPSPRAAAELASFADKADALLVGPGMMDEAAAGELALRLAANARSMVLDAGALTGLKDRRREVSAIEAPVILTPHAGEMAALTGLTEEEVRADPAKLALAFARDWSVHMVLKGQTTFIATPTGELWRHDGGVVGLGVSGSGDVLAGAMAGLIARGAQPHVAAVWAVWAHAAAGRALTARIGQVGFLPREVADDLPHHL